MKNINPLYIIYESRLDDVKFGAINGGIAGGVLGITGGNIIANHHLKQSKIIKKIIIESDTPEECIAQIEKLGTKSALSYCKMIKKVFKERPDDWKKYLIKWLNMEIVTTHAAGSLVGGYVGNRLGQLGGIYVAHNYL